MAKDFKIAKTQGVCSKCEQPLEPGEEIFALVRAGAEELQRQDFHLGCWAGGDCEPAEPIADAQGDEAVDTAEDTSTETVNKSPQDNAPAESTAEKFENPQDDPNVLGVWRTHIPHPEEKKKLLIDNALLVNFFERLEGHEDLSKLKFRYVLTLILMRKRLLNYEGMTTEDGVDIWKMRLRGTERFYKVIDPKLDEEQISEVSASLGEIMEGDFE
ncbi:MAG: hypothetical protein KAR11_00245 [Phycisphaerae bacterium]|nr:hypothetical protein [Phycisphaerae bacterium]